MDLRNFGVCGWGRSGCKDNVKQGTMVIVMVFIGITILISLITGFRGFDEFELSMEVKGLSNPYYRIGLSFLEYTTEDPECIEQEFRLSLFFVEVVLIFFKENEA